MKNTERRVVDKAVRAALREAGAVLSRWKGKHLVYKLPNGRAVTLSKSGSDGFRGISNQLADIRRAQAGLARPDMLTVLMAATVVLVVLSIYAAYQDEAKWQDFKSRHDCVVVAQKAMQLLPTTVYDYKGNPVPGTTVVPSQTAWKCDDGITYWR